jgi:hypothetical protein
MQNIAEMTPVEIDTILKGMWNEQDTIAQKIVGYQRANAETRVKIQQIKNGVRLVGYNTVLDGIELMEQTNLLGENIEAYRDELALLKTKSLPYENEYVRRGGWNRVFLAKSTNGHAHNGQECSTCHNGESRTQFEWLVQYSGKTESEIVADAGERACTTCYQTAPAADLKRPTKMFTPDEIEAQGARQEREAAKVRKVQAVNEKGITTPEGRPVFTDTEHRNSNIAKTLRTAEIAATDALVDVINERRREGDPEWAWRSNSAEKLGCKAAYNAWYLMRAIAFKKGVEFAEVAEVHMKKAEAKIRKIDREWAKDPRNPNRTK